MGDHLLGDTRQRLGLVPGTTVVGGLGVGEGPEVGTLKEDPVPARAAMDLEVPLRLGLQDGATARAVERSARFRRQFRLHASTVRRPRAANDLLGCESPGRVGGPSG